MASGIEHGIQVVKSYADNDAYGYELHSRDYTVGTDCAGLMRLYAASVEGVDVAKYPEFGTWSEKATLTARGWTAVPFDYYSAVRGDVFLRALGDSTGHTVVFLGNGQIIGAEGDKDGKHGDSSGKEVCQKAYYAYSYNWILRPPSKYAGSSSTSGSSSSGTSTKHTSASFAGRYRLNTEMNIRTSPSINGAIACTFPKGKVLTLKGEYWVVREDHKDNRGSIDWCWGTYTGVNTGTKYYVCTGRYTGKAESDDFLTKL